LLASAKQLVSWWASGEITPHVSACVPLSRAHDAFDLLESRQSTGKVVVVPD
jgi:NADPH2:quinone reductase